MGRDLRSAQYLEALGLESWVLRGPAAPPASAPPSPLPPPMPERVAGLAANWRALADEVAVCVRCRLHERRTQTVFGVGDPGAELLVIGEAPGADEDRQGEPFVGRSGQLLNSMLLAAGWPRSSVYIANIIKCRPPDNRDPLPEEVRCCMPYLHRQIDLLGPRLMLAVGRVAAQTLLATDTPIGKLRGAVHHFGTRGTPLIVTYHPAYLLRSPREKRRAWDDLRFVRSELARRRAAAPGGSA
ncbi:MAG TPA: uracil-DNA glycosylase [Steroidobacteraceae bacterium]|nr:uracil-DNA glycosylase [Steroidobacteraceae bacterium]